MKTKFAAVKQYQSFNKFKRKSEAKYTSSYLRLKVKRQRPRTK